MSSYLLDSQVSRAEILYYLKIVKSHASMRSAGDLRQLIRAMFPDSKVAEVTITITPPVCRATCARPTVNRVSEC